jgi:hypothetical protein
MNSITTYMPMLRQANNMQMKRMSFEIQNSSAAAHMPKTLVSHATGINKSYPMRVGIWKFEAITNIYSNIRANNIVKTIFVLRIFLFVFKSIVFLITPKQSKNRTTMEINLGKMKPRN